MKRRLVKILCFAAVFVLLFAGFGQVLAHNWSWNEYVEERYADFTEEPQSDVIYIGASNVYASVCPTVIWGEAGITGYNFGTSSTNMMLNYYQLQYIFSVQRPKLLVVDVTGLEYRYDPTDNSPSGEAAFQKVLSTMPDRSIRLKLLKDMRSRWDGADLAMYVFPTLRYHERWEEPTKYDFDRTLLSERYPAFGKGCYMSAKTAAFEPSDLAVNRKLEVQEINMEYLEKIRELCRDSGVELMLMNSPNLKIYRDSRVKIEAYAKENGLNYLHFESAEEIQEIGLRLDQHFYNKKHLNIMGQRVFSEFLAGYITEHYSIETHEADSALCDVWNQTYQEYLEYYEAAER